MTNADEGMWEGRDAGEVNGNGSEGDKEPVGWLLRKKEGTAIEETIIERPVLQQIRRHIRVSYNVPVTILSETYHTGYSSAFLDENCAAL